MKKVGLISLVALLITVLLFAFTGCKSVDKSKFIGKFESSWVDVDNSDPDQRLSFILTLYKGNTAYLERYEGEQLEWTKAGTWKGTADKQNYSVICIFNDTDTKRNSLSTYLTLTLLEDNSILGMPSLTSAGLDILSCFGYGTHTYTTSHYTYSDSYIISAVIFTKS